MPPETTQSLPWLHQIDPILLQLGPVAIHWYALMYIAGAGFGWWLGVRRAREPWRGIAPGEMEDLVFYGMLGIIVGGRLGYMLFYGWANLAANPLNLLKVWEGGMSFHGGMLGAILAMLLWARKHRRDSFAVLDFMTPLVPLGLGLGRIGNFVGGELWGRRTDVSWGVIFPQALDGAPLPREQLLALYHSGALNAQARHPSQLYQALFEGVLLFAIVWWYSRQPRPKLSVLALLTTLYGIGRFAIEFVREPDAHLGPVAFGWMSMGQLLSLPMIVGGLALFAWAWRTQPVPGAPAPAA